MIFYQVLGTSEAPCCLVGTQVDAKQLSRERGTSWEQVDVPTDKAGLMAYVNQLKAGVNAEIHRDVGSADGSVGYAGSTPVDPQPTTALGVPTPTRTTNEIVSFILDDAAVNQCADIFAALGQRFKELVK